MIPVYSSSTSPLSSSGLVDSAEISLLHNEPAEADNGMNDLTLCMTCLIRDVDPSTVIYSQFNHSQYYVCKKVYKFGQCQAIVLHLLPTSLLIFCQFVKLVYLFRHCLFDVVVQYPQAVVSIQIHLLPHLSHHRT